MNFRKLGKILGKIMISEGILMIAPLIIAFVYNEGLKYILAFVIPAVLLCVLGLLIQLPKVPRNTLYQREGFALVAFGWIVMTLFGALPFVINGDIPNYIDACFEIMSGFTTTGASIVDDITVLSHSTLLWRSFSHWIGGMGMLVFVLIFIPESNEGSSMHLLRAESPGPQVGKIVSKLKVTTRILYLIYFGLTVLEFIILLFDKPIPGYENEKVFFSILTALGSAGTGGFGFIPGSLELFNPFSQYVVAVFLILFGVNFSLYYLLLLGQIRAVFKSQELRTYGLIIAISLLIIFISLLAIPNAYSDVYTTEETFRHSLFQVATIITTTGYTTTDFNLWPIPAITTLLILMFFGAMAGSTAGGIKTSRLLIALKGSYINIRQLINPRYVPKSKFEGKSLEDKVVTGVFAFITMYIFVLFFVTLLLSFDPVNGQTVVIASDVGEYAVNHGFLSNFSSAMACISNIGPGLEGVGAYSCYSGFSAFSKMLLTLTMLIGRLEILPVLILFNPKAWKKF